MIGEKCMRIGVPMKSFNPSWGGPGTYTVELVNRMIRATPSHEYVLVYPAEVSARIDRAPGERLDNLREIGTDVRSGPWWDQVTLPRVCMRENIDVMFSPFMSIPVLGGFKKVFTIHGAERYVVPDMLPFWQGLKWTFMEKVLVPIADRLIVVSETMGNDLCKAIHCQPDKLRATYLGVAKDFRVIGEREELEATRKKHGVPEQFLLFVGRIFPNKNFGNLVRGFAACADSMPHKLVVVGGTRWKFEDDFKLLRELGIEDRVIFLDFISKEDLIRLYNLASCLVYPSFYESFGLVQLEAMACGCPVVAARSGALPEIAGDAALFCDPHDPRDIARAIVELVNDPAKRAAQVEKALARSQAFTWDRCAAETLRILAEVTDDPRALRAGGLGAARH
jgi:glycosyltransferase involved in cell wall biosynthesis